MVKYGGSVVQVPILVEQHVEHEIHVHLIVGGLVELELLICLRGPYLVRLFTRDHWIPRDH
jgi:hypothetical protein